MDEKGRAKSPALSIALMSVLTAVVVVFTIFPRIPTPIHGYINLSDVIITFSAYLFGPIVAAVAGGLGTGLADVIGGFPQWAPFSFLIHGAQGVMIALIARIGLKKGVPGDAKIYMQIIGGMVGMVIGGEVLSSRWFLYGFRAALVEIPSTLSNRELASSWGLWSQRVS